VVAAPKQVVAAPKQVSKATKQLGTDPKAAKKAMAGAKSVQVVDGDDSPTDPTYSPLSEDQ
jgi:hypothetical protein